MLSHALVGQESFHAVLVEGLSTSASASSAKHQAAEIIRKANTGGASSRHGQFASGQKVPTHSIVLQSFLALTPCISLTTWTLLFCC